MSSWLQQQATSHQLQLAATAAVSGLVVACSIFGVQAIQRQIAIDDLKASIPNIDENHTSEAVRLPLNCAPSNSQLIILVKVPDYNNPTKRSISSKEDERAAALANRAQNGDYDQGMDNPSTTSIQIAGSHKAPITELVDEQLTRTSSFLTPDGLTKLRSSFVIVIGLGGVGSHCTAALARSGISHIRLIDFDQVTLSSLNRHALATLADVGTPKVHCVRKRLQAIVPWIKWECINEIWRKDQATRLLGPLDTKDGLKHPDYVVDAIDNIDSKVDLLHYCHENGIKVISSMGAGCKSDPTRIFVGDISSSIEDPLSRVTRARLKLRGVREGISVVYSTEKPGPGKASLLPLPEEEFQKGKVGELSVLPDFRARILPVLGTMPAVFGYVVANFVIMEITNYPHEISSGKGRDKLYDQVLSGLQGLEERLVRSVGQNAIGLKIPISKDEIGFLVDEIWRGKSAITGISTRLALTRWRAPSDYEIDTRWAEQKASKLRLDELVCMTKEEAAIHEQQVLKAKQRPEDVYDAPVVEQVERRLREVVAYERLR